MAVKGPSRAQVLREGRSQAVGGDVGSFRGSKDGRSDGLAAGGGRLGPAGFTVFLFGVFSFLQLLELPEPETRSVCWSGSRFLTGSRCFLAPK